MLINLHGGGFNSDSGSLIEGVPIANLAKIKVVSVYYRLRSGESLSCRGRRRGRGLQRIAEDL